MSRSSDPPRSFGSGASWFGWSDGGIFLVCFLSRARGLGSLLDILMDKSHAGNT